MDKDLQLVFQNAAGKNVTMDIPDVKDDVAEADVKNLMQLILAKNIFESTGGALTGIVSASLVSKDVTKYNVK